jgi:hypothetical protein
MKNITKSLLDLRRKLEKRFSFFPSDCCRVSSQEIEEKFRFKQTFGLFIDKNGIGHGHHWNLDSDGNIEDITANQFDKLLPDVYLLKRDSSEAEKYVEGAYYMI